MDTKLVKPRILILGAGLAGLTAAYKLLQYDAQILLLEARDRVGGRVDTRIIDGSPNLTVEMGGEWIAKNHKQIIALCKENNLMLINHKMKRDLLHNSIYYKAGKWQLSKRWQYFFKKLMAIFPQLDENIKKELDEIDWWHFLIKNNISESDREILNITCSSDFGEDTRFISAYAVLSYYYYRDNEEHACALRIAGGNYKLLQGLAEKIGNENILLNHEVQAIFQDIHQITVTCTNGKLFKADYVITTLPIFALTKIHWQPLLPRLQQKAFQALSYNRITKTALVYKERFWKNDDFELLTDSFVKTIYHATKGQNSRKGILTAYTVGDCSYALSNLNNEQKEKIISDVLSVSFGNYKKDVEQIISYNWTDDPYTKGGYSLFKKIYPLEQIELLRQPFRKIYFAGEHTADQHGFMEGAVESGIRVTYTLSKKLKKNKIFQSI